MGQDDVSSSKILLPHLLPTNTDGYSHIEYGLNSMTASSFHAWADDAHPAESTFAASTLAVSMLARNSSNRTLHPAAIEAGSSILRVS